MQILQSGCLSLLRLTEHNSELWHTTLNGILSRLLKVSRELRPLPQIFFHCDWQPEAFLNSVCSCLSWRSRFFANLVRLLKSGGFFTSNDQVHLEYFIQVLESLGDDPQCDSRYAVKWLRQHCFVSHWPRNFIQANEGHQHKDSFVQWSFASQTHISISTCVHSVYMRGCI